MIFVVFDAHLISGELTFKILISGISFSIRISFNVNHTVDADAETEVDARQDDIEIGEMKSKPTFNIDIIRGKQTLGFTCSFNNEPGASGANDSYSMFCLVGTIIYIIFPIIFQSILYLVLS